MSASTQTDVAALLLVGLARSGVTDVVVSPGSRNTPFVFAAQEAGLREHVVIDERAAAFFALGMARVTGRPVLLSCTSGSAGAHYLPAIIEASASHVPLIALTADRPHDLARCGAPQTIEQSGLFGTHVRMAFDVAVADDRAGQLDAALRVAAQAVTGSLAPDPGPVHINARAAKPLEPTAATNAIERTLHETATRMAANGPTRVWPAQTAPSPDALRVLADACRRAERGLVVCGPAPLERRAEREAIFDFARATGFPVAAEATSQLRFTSSASMQDVVVADALLPALRLGAVSDRLRADLVVQIGESPIAPGWEAWCDARGARERWVIAPNGWCDPFGRADARLIAQAGETMRALVEMLDENGATRRSEAWVNDVRELSDGWWRALDESASEQTDETEVVRTIVELLPPNALLSVGNSRAVRLLDHCRAGVADVSVMSQRGASGIDGPIAASAGAAVVWPGPVVLVLGDVSFVHDVGALVLARECSSPLVIVVVNNDGGRLFEELPVARAWGRRASTWTTPHGLALASIARSFGLSAASARDSDELRAVLATALTRGGATVVEVVVAPEAERGRKARTDEMFAKWFAAKEQDR